jgi:lysine 2,3-aminomutase
MFDEKTTDFYRELCGRFPVLRRMVERSDEESVVRPEETGDPIGDTVHAVRAGGRLIRRYKDRALLLVTDRCAAHCRFCFRGRMVGGGSDISPSELDDAAAYIKNDKDIKEVILSGGDPFSLTDRRLAEIIGVLKDGAGVRTVRIHTRFPVYEPARCVGADAASLRADVIVLHVNHSAEVTPEFRAAAANLGKHAPLLCQSVLLKGVNDSAAELEALSRALLSAGVIPYYLHYPDAAPGVSRFRIPLDEAAGLVSSLRERLPGYLVPRFVVDLPGGLGKTILSGSDPFKKLPSGKYLLESPLTKKPVEFRGE